jgi:lipoate-protein ligase A
MTNEATTGEAATGVRLIDAGCTSPLRAQALYHGIADAMTPGDLPVVVLAEPDAPFVSVGAHQDVSREVDTQACARSNMPIIRRATGGPALTLSANTMMVHFVLPRGRPEVGGSAVVLYGRFTEPLVRAWQAFGLPVERCAWGGIELARYRMAGVQAGMVGKALVVGGSLVTDFDADTIVRQASLPSDHIREQIRDMIRQRLSQAGRPIDRAAVKAALSAGVGDALGWILQESALRDDEQAAIERRAAQMVQMRHLLAGGQRMANANMRATGGLKLVDLVHRSAGGLVRLRLLERAGVIEEIEITGELTSLPADGLEKLAAGLVGLRRDAPDLAVRIHGRMGLLGLELPGITAAELAAALKPVSLPAGRHALDVLFGIKPTS